LEVEEFSYQFIGLLAEAFGFPADTLKPFYDTVARMQHSSKMVQCPQTDSSCAPEWQGSELDRPAKLRVKRRWN
jgi:hypothetical protein